MTFRSTIACSLESSPLDVIAPAAKSGVVDQNANLNPCLGDLAIQRLRGFARSHIPRKDMHLGAMLCLQLCFQLLERVFAPGNENQISASCGVVAGECGTDT